MKRDLKKPATERNQKAPARSTSRHGRKDQHKSGRRKSALGAVITLVVLIAVMASGVPFISGRASEAENAEFIRARALPIGYDLTLSTINRLKLTRNPTARENLLEYLRGRRRSFEPALTWLVARTGHPRHADAVAFLATLNDGGTGQGTDAPTENRDGASGAVDEPETAVDETGPEDPLVTQLGEADPIAKTLTINRIGAVGCGSPELQLAVVEQLESELVTVREAASNALPDQICDKARAALLDLLGSRDSRGLVVRILARLESTDRQKVEIVNALESYVVDGDPEVIAELGPLAGMQEMKPVLWKLALETDVVIDSRLAALRMLDDLESDAALIPKDVSEWSPRMLYYGGRMLCRDHQQRGIDILLGVADRRYNEDTELDAAVWSLLAALVALEPHTQPALIRARLNAPDFAIPDALPPAARL